MTPNMIPRYVFVARARALFHLFCYDGNLLSSNGVQCRILVLPRRCSDIFNDYYHHTNTSIHTCIHTRFLFSSLFLLHPFPFLTIDSIQILNPLSDFFPLHNIYYFIFYWNYGQLSWFQKDWLRDLLQLPFLQHVLIKIILKSLEICFFLKFIWFEVLNFIT